MAIGFIYSGNPLNGSSIDDFVIDFGYDNGGANTINGNAGDDLILGDFGYHYQIAAGTNNNSLANAIELDDSSGVWSTDENPLVANSAIPHATAFVEASAGQSEFFSVDIGAGQTITADIDFGDSSAIGTDVDTIVYILDSGGNVVATNDDDYTLTDGGAGSVNGHDSYLTYTPAAAGTYYVEVRRFSGGAANFAGGETFVLNLSVTGHNVYPTSAPVGADTIRGGIGDDTIYGVNGDDTIIWAAGDGSDTINGGSGSDLLDLTGSTSGWTVDLRAGTGSNADGDTLTLALVERLNGTNYADSLRSYGGGSVINALGGNDIVYAVNGVPETLDGGTGVDTIDTTDYNSASNYTINLVTGATNAGESYTNFENLVSGDTLDTVTGTIAANVITTNGGYDIVHAGDGADTVYGGEGGGALYGDEGNDKLYGGSGIDYIYGGTGVDYMAGGDGTDVYYVDASNDRVAETTTGGFDYVYSSVSYALNANVEELILTGSGPIDGKGNGSDNVILGTNDVNVLLGNDGADYLAGYGGNDILNGGRGADQMYGGTGNDVYYVDDAADLVGENAGEGTDKVSAAVDYTLTADVENLSLTGIAKFGTGNGLANLIIGSTGNNVISGLAGADNLQGGAGNDTISGGADNDVIYGDAGRDILTGDAGSDRFAYREGDTGNTNATADQITDFTHGIDKIVLSLLDANVNTAPDNAFTWIANAAFSHTAGELHYVLQGGNTVVQGDTNGDGVADIVIVLTNTIPLTASDFVL